MARRGPPQPLGEGANVFSVSAATPLPLSADSHPSGVSVRVKLDSSSHPGQPFRTSELIQGRVHIYAPSPEIISAAARLSLRIFFESRTLFWNLEPVLTTGKVAQRLEKVKSPVARDYQNVMRYEVHRGVVPSNKVNLSWSPGSPIALEYQLGTRTSDGRLEVVLPFSFTVPRRMTITEYNQMERAPRDLCSVERCPPPTLRDCRNASVQWVAEAILNLRPNSSPAQDDAMLRQPTYEEVVSRLVFPVVPALKDVGALKDEPYFGENPNADEYSSRRLSESEQESKKKASLNAVRARGGSWEAHVKELLHDSGKRIVSEVYTTAGARILSSALSLPVIAYLKIEKGSSNALASLFRSSKSRAIYLQHATVSLTRIWSTRGGKEIRPHNTKLLLRRQEHRFGQESSASTPGLLVPFEENANPLEVDLTLDLQSEMTFGEPGSEHTATAARYFTPSFRTPNIQYEYQVTVSYTFSGDGSTGRFATGFNVQFMPGDESQLPRYE
ncbi:hypothetical protein RhiJN_22897 [Ceratobasidium sp. AG-Ba]|nr:hypothetical protein RhiJN_22897 [Ceratobasidium sp. AG-Ba]